MLHRWRPKEEREWRRKPQGDESVAPAADDAASAVEEAPEDRASMEVQVERGPEPEVEREEIGEQLPSEKDFYQAEDESEVQFSSYETKKEEITASVSQAEDESVPKPSSDEVKPEELTATVSQGEDERVPSDDVRLNELTATVSQGEDERST